MTKLKAALIASVMVSMGASDALANRGRTRTGNNNNSARQQRQRQNRTRNVARRTAVNQQRNRSQSANARVQAAMYKQVMHDAIGRNATPPFFLVPQRDKVKLKQTRQGNYEKRTTPAYKISGLKKTGELSLTALLPVSAHTGQAKEFAKSNKYTVIFKAADGRTRTIKDIPSTGLITEQSLKLKLAPGKNIVQFYPQGSPAKVAGFKAGREIEIEWSGGN